MATPRPSLPDHAAHSAQSLAPSCVARLPQKARGVLAALRSVAGLVGCEKDAALWVAFDQQDQRTADERVRLLRLLAGAELFQLLPDQQLVPWGKIVPTERLPEGEWTPISHWIQPEFPKALFAPTRPPAVRLALVRSDDMIDSTLLRVELAMWADFVRQAPKIRLDRWEFAASESGDVLVRGLPLPALPGERLWERDGLIIPAGWTWTPHVASSVVRQVLGLQAGEWALWSAAGSRWERLSAEAFVPARRASVAQTWREFSEGGSTP